MFTVCRTRLASDIEHWQLRDAAGASLSFEQVFRSWAADEEFRRFWNAGLRDVPFSGYCWECPAVSVQDWSRPFECVFVSSRPLARLQQNPDPFTEHFPPGCKVATFESRGRDALLVAPCPGTPGVNFAHLAVFASTAASEHASAFWKSVGEALRKKTGPIPIWLSTSGFGVSWLHVRLDSRPKYYQYAPYKARPGPLTSCDTGA